MRIKQISITKLFGIFDHVIPLNLDERITIIHGINGVGKTSILKLINGLFNIKYSDIRSIPFQDFKISFDQGDYVLVTKDSQEENKKSKILALFQDKNGTKEKFDFQTLFRNIKGFRERSLSFEEYIPELKRISLREWFYLPDGDILSLEEIIERFGHRLPLTIGEEFKQLPEWLQNLRESLNVRLIESQRLFRFSNDFRSESIRNRSPKMELSVVTYSDELVENIQLKLTEYGKLSQSLDRTFPARVMKTKIVVELTDSQLREKLEQLENERKNLIHTGLLIQDESNFQITDDNLDESTRKLLSVYVEDVERKLNVFSDLAPKIELFQRIINQRFTHKTLVINQGKGFILETDQGEPLSLTDLSSGEQHELVMLYELLFKVKPGSLILIDEPEISLHVGWQVKFLEDLQEIAKLADIDILLATHSPDIINGRWDLTVELKGKGIS
ncbi:MAG: AAA family ATPase [Merismopediaceae bacterium]|nr:AAA family ATPase [Merismopediaceae bacterium]